MARCLLCLALAAALAAGAAETPPARPDAAALRERYDRALAAHTQGDF